MVQWYRKVRVFKHQRGLFYRDGEFQRLVQPGVHRLWFNGWPFARRVICPVSTLETVYTDPLLDVMLAESSFAQAVEVVKLSDTQRALVWKDGRLACILGPGQHALWREPYKLKIELFDITHVRFEHEKLDVVLALPQASKWLTGVSVESHETVLLLRDGEMIDQLGAGKYVFWTGCGRITWQAIDRREQSADVAGQEIMTADKVTLRVNLLVSYQVTDPVQAVTEVSDYTQALYREAQLVLRAAIGTRKLDELLEDKQAVGDELAAVLAKRVSQFGLTVRSVGLRDIILPGEMKAILNQVIQAEKEAQANLIRRREETAAARSQANTARLMADNPVLARMKELESLQSILAGTSATFVLGSGELTEQVRSLIAQDSAKPKR